MDQNYELIDWRDPTLRRPSEPFDFDSPQVDPFELKDLLEEKMKKLRGLGLSAVQVGLPYRVFSMKTEPDATIFNPRIVDASEQEVELEEGCLSLPGLFMKVKRPRLIKLRFQVADGETRTLKLDGITARIVSHEVDHLDGRMFFDSVSDLKLRMAMKKASKKGYLYSLGALRGLC